MVQSLIYALFIAAIIAEYLFEKIGARSKVFAILPEMISMILFVYVLLGICLGKKMNVRLRYIFFFAAFAAHVTIGILGNQVQPLAIFSGIRTYFKFLPIFLVPLVFDITNKNIIKFMLFFCCLACIQLPLATYQRFVEFAGWATGDYIKGTLSGSGVLTVFLTCCIAVLISSYLKKYITLKMFVPLLAVFFIPTALNETKATILLLPIAILVPTLITVNRETGIKIIAIIIPACIIAGAGFQIIYKHIYSGRADMVEFYASEKAVDYLYKGSREQYITGEHEGDVRRLDGIVLAYKQVEKDFFTLVWGVGIGNAIVSFSSKFEGKYSSKYRLFGGKQNGIATFLWEIGLLGIVHVIWFLFLILIDAWRFRKQRDFYGVLATGWVSVSVIFFIALPYQNLITKNELMYPFCFFSGIIAALFSVSNEKLMEFHD